MTTPDGATAAGATVASATVDGAPDRAAQARAIADAVLYEGYLLYPYRASARKNQVRWQFGVLGPPGAAAGGLGEESQMSVECLVRARAGTALTVTLRFLQLQCRLVQERAVQEPMAAEQDSAPEFRDVESLSAGASTWMTWDEAVEREVTLGSFEVADLDGGGQFVPVDVDGGADLEELRDEQGSVIGRLIRRRWPLHATVQVGATPTASGRGLLRLRVVAENMSPEPATTASEAIRSSFIGAHLLLSTELGEFVSLLDPGDGDREAAASCRQHRWWPVLIGDEHEHDTHIVLASPIILGDYPELAPESNGALFDSTEIDEILTLRILTMTEQEKAEARATDRRAAEIIDRCEQMSSEDLQRMHGALRDPRGLAFGRPSVAEPSVAEPSFGGSSFGGPSFGGPGQSVLGEAEWSIPTFSTPSDTDRTPWWDPASDASVRPDQDAITIDGVRVTSGSIVRVQPTRRADAQDLFFAGQIAKVTGVNFDVDGGTHVAVVLVDDPAADMHEWYGRYLYFAPDELVPIEASSQQPKENPS